MGRLFHRRASRALHPTHAISPEFVVPTRSACSAPTCSRPLPQHHQRSGLGAHHCSHLSRIQGERHLPGPAWIARGRNLGGFSTRWGDTPNIIESSVWGLTHGDFFAQIVPVNFGLMALLSLTVSVRLILGARQPLDSIRPCRPGLPPCPLRTAGGGRNRSHRNGRAAGGHRGQRPRAAPDL